MNRLSEVCAIDIGLEPQALSNTNATGDYRKMDMHQRSLWILQGGAMATGTTTKIELYEATSAAAGSAQAITGATATITANTDVTEATVDLAGVGTDDVVTINSIDFTKADVTAAASRTFANAAGLVTCVNDATYGVAGVTASADGTTVTLKASDEPAGSAITVSKTDAGGTITLATVSAQAYVELDTSDMDIVDSFDHVAAKVTTTADTVVGVTALRYDGRFTPTQRVGDSAIV